MARTGTNRNLNKAKRMNRKRFNRKSSEVGNGGERERARRGRDEEAEDESRRKGCFLLEYQLWL